MPKIAQTRTATNREMLQRGKKKRKRRTKEQINKDFLYNIQHTDKGQRDRSTKNRQTHIQKGIWTTYNKAGSK